MFSDQVYALLDQSAIQSLFHTGPKLKYFLLVIGKVWDELLTGITNDWCRVRTPAQSHRYVPYQLTKLSCAMRSLIKLLSFLGLVVISLWLILARPFVWFSDCCAAKSLADPVALERYTRKISTEFAPRDWKHVVNLNRLSDFISNEFRRTNSDVYFQEFSIQGSTYRNIISEYGSSEKGAPTIVVGAHYDAFGESEGADDNASGVAGLLELGRMLSSQSPSVRVILVAYSLEEPPFFRSAQMGSAVHAASLVASKENVRLMISLEMIGYFSDLSGSQSYPSSILNLFYPSRGNFIAAIGPLSFSSATINFKRAFSSSVSLPIKSMNAPAAIPGIDFSDHLNYW